jgi:hypothetical protein
MHRPIASVGLALVLAGVGLMAFPLVAAGKEVLDVEQIVGFLLAPVGVFVVMVAAASEDPRRTTVGGAFGNPEEPPPPSRVPAMASTARPRLRYPDEPVHCRFCRSVITADLARCPRCSRARECRPCGRPLGQVLERPTCPACARAEPMCNCTVLPRPRGSSVRRGTLDVGP